MTESPSTSNPGTMAQPIVSHIQLLAIELIAASSVRYPSLDRRGTFDAPINAKHSISATFHDQSRQVIAAVKFEVNAEDESTKLASWSAIYRLVYQVDENYDGDLTKERAEAFCQTYSLAHSWPYWREHLASHSIKMGLPCVLAPIMVVGATPVIQRAIPVEAGGDER
jgi:hypothetical protein